MKNLWFAILALFVSHAYAQPIKLKTLEVNDTIIQAAIDRAGDFYLITKDGQIQKFTKDGALLLVYKHNPLPTLFDPRDGVRLFAYYRNVQQYNYFNPSFEIHNAFRIDSAFAIQPWLICPSGDYKLWILDSVDHSLKRVNLRDGVVEIEVIVDVAYIKDTSLFTMMREYQGFVFLLNPKEGIHVFNNMGKHIKTIKAHGLKEFNFLGEELYYPHKGSVHFFNLFTGETREMPWEKPVKSVLITDERFLNVGLKSVDIFAFKP